jgi:hypothetical protein
MRGRRGDEDEGAPRRSISKKQAGKGQVSGSKVKVEREKRGSMHAQEGE